MRCKTVTTIVAKQAIIIIIIIIRSIVKTYICSAQTNSDQY